MGRNDPEPFKQEEMEREKQCISVLVLVRFFAYAHDVEAIYAFDTRN